MGLKPTLITLNKLFTTCLKNKPYYPFYYYKWDSLKPSQHSVVEKSSPTIMGECNAEKISLLFEKNTTSKVIDLNVPETGNYYLSGVVQCSAGQKENLKVTIDGKKLSEEMVLTEKDKWTVASLTDNKNEATVYLSKGKHQVKITYGNSETPNISDIAVYRAGKANKPNLAAYEKYFKKLKSARLPANYASQKSKGIQNARIAPNPKGTYEHELDVDVAYTFYESNYYNQGEVVTFETKDRTTDPVMYFFNTYGSPLNASQSWVNDDHNGDLNSYISVTIPVSGSYMLLLKAYSSPFAGTCNLWKNGALYKSNVAVAGKLFSGSIKPNTDVNFFTAKQTAGTDTRLFLTVGLNGEKMMYQNDDYSSYPASSDFGWGINSRIKARFTNQSMYYALLSAYSPTSTGKCDIYMNVLNASNEVLSVFPNLKRDDAMQSAPKTGLPKIRPGSYNCISWSGGISEFWSWPSIFSQWTIRIYNYQETFDNFYGNRPQRYAGATTYTRDGANESNASVALWANPNLNISTEPYNTQKFTHASVTKPGNNNPHGYDWESKPGTLERIFHPRNALSNLSYNGGYGNIVSYYKVVGSAGARIASEESVSLEESIANGWSEMDNAYLEQPEIDKLDYLCQNIPSQIANEFYGLFYALNDIAPDSSYSFSSNPYEIYANNTAYQNLLNWCNSHGAEIYPLIMKNYAVDNRAMLLIASEILATAYPDLLESVKSDNTSNASNNAN